MPAKLSTEPVLYPRVDWFDHHEENQSQEHDKNGEVKSTKEYVLYVAIPVQALEQNSILDICPAINKIMQTLDMHIIINIAQILYLLHKLQLKQIMYSCMSNQPEQFNSILLIELQSEILKYRTGTIIIEHHNKRCGYWLHDLESY